jgi:hypothetical protein
MHSRYSGKDEVMPEEKYPLEVESVGSDTYIVMSRGHHDLDLFMSEVLKDYGDWNLGGASHVWIKTSPAKDGWRYNIVDQSTRGAWPATYCWEYGEGYEKWCGQELAS